MMEFHQILTNNYNKYYSFRMLHQNYFNLKVGNQISLSKGFGIRWGNTIISSIRNKTSLGNWEWLNESVWFTKR
jgi:hypothetical protein